MIDLESLTKEVKEYSSPSHKHSPRTDHVNGVHNESGEEDEKISKIDNKLEKGKEILWFICERFGKLTRKTFFVTEVSGLSKLLESLTGRIQSLEKDESKSISEVHSRNDEKVPVKNSKASSTSGEKTSSAEKDDKKAETSKEKEQKTPAEENKVSETKEVLPEGAKTEMP